MRLETSPCRKDREVFARASATNFWWTAQGRHPRSHRHDRPSGWKQMFTFVDILDGRDAKT